MSTLHRIHPRRKPAPTRREQFDDALGFALLIAAATLGFRFYGWLIELFLSHFPL